MPREITKTKEFVTITRRADAKLVKVKRNARTGVTKFKIRCSKYLYTFKTEDPKMTDKLTHSLPPNLNKQTI
mgnify:CR=1 FL=1|jgi:large subunit ribosomal protein L38e